MAERSRNLKPNGTANTLANNQMAEESKSHKIFGSFKLPSFRSRSKSRENSSFNRQVDVPDLTQKPTHPDANGSLTPEEKRALYLRKRTSSSVLQRVKPTIEQEYNHSISLNYQEAMDSLIADADTATARNLRKEFTITGQPPTKVKIMTQEESIDFSDSIVNINTAISCEFINDIQKRYSPNDKADVGNSKNHQGISNLLTSDLSPTPPPPEVSQTLPRNFKPTVTSSSAVQDVPDYSNSKDGRRTIVVSTLEKGVKNSHPEEKSMTIMTDKSIKNSSPASGVESSRRTPIKIVGLDRNKSPVKVFSATSNQQSVNSRSRSESPGSVFVYEAPSSKRSTGSLLPSCGRLVRKSDIKPSLTDDSTYSSPERSPAKQKLTFSPDVEKVKVNGTIEFNDPPSPKHDMPGRGHVQEKITMFEKAKNVSEGSSPEDKGQHSSSHLRGPLTPSSQKKSFSPKSPQDSPNSGGDDPLQPNKLKNKKKSYENTLNANTNCEGSPNHSSVLEKSVGPRDQTDSVTVPHRMTVPHKMHSMTDENYKKLVQVASGYKYNDYVNIDSIGSDKANKLTIANNNTSLEVTKVKIHEAAKNEVNGDVVNISELTLNETAIKSNGDISENIRFPSNSANNLGQGHDLDKGSVVAGAENCEENGVLIKKDGDHFLSMVKQQESRLNKLCEETESELQANSNIPEDACGKLRAASGKAHLLINQRFKQFKDLCHKNLNPEDDDPFQTTSQDLEGFWDMVLLQVEDVVLMFDEIDSLRKNNWQELTTPEKKLPLKRTPSNSSYKEGKTDQLSGSKGKQRHHSKSEKEAEANMKREAQNKARHEARKRFLAAKKAAARRQRTSSSGDEVER